MNKLIKAFSIVSISCAGASLLYMCAALTVLRTFLLNLFGAPTEIISLGPVLPFTVTTSVIAVLAFATVLITTAPAKGSSAFEFVAFGVLVAGLPLFNFILSYLQNVYTASMGVYYSVAMSITASTLSPSSLLTGIASGTILVVCGMRIAMKLKR